MLTLHRLELSGFKSFVDPLSVDFPGGLTAVVGPNGCGKSNLADAILWVIGERSPKHLRAGTMDDVIFNGSEGRRPLGSAEVRLIFAAPPGTAGADDGFLTIGRRVFRSGESEYRINGRRSTLKEIKDLLMDTGLGFREYSVIEQGRIGQILSGKPLERRKLIEEAAGITRYRERRRAAEVKIEEAKANLARIDDVLEEVGRAVRSLKRQAGAARRWREQEARYKTLLAEALTARWHDARRRLADLAGALAAKEASEAELVARLSREDADLAAAREALEALGQELAERHRRQAELAAAIEGRQQLLKSSRERLAEASERLVGGRALAERRHAELERRRAAEAEIGAALAAAAADRDRAAAALGAEEERTRSIEIACQDAERRLEALREKLLASIGAASDLRNRLHLAQVEREKGRFRQHQLEQELARKQAELAAAADEIAAGAAGLRELVDAAGRREEALASLREQLRSVVEREAGGGSRRGERAESLAELRRRRRVLLELGEVQSARRRALLSRLAEAGMERPTLLADLLRVPRGWERTVDLYLGELADAVVLAPDVDGDALAGALAAGPGTAALLRPADAGAEPAPAEAEPRVDDGAVIGALAGALDLPPAVAAALPPVYLVRSAEDAVRLARGHPGVAFLARGRAWAQGGILRLQGAAAAPGLLARAGELADLETAIPAAEAALAAAEEELAAAAAERAERAAAVQAAEELAAQERRALAVASARQEDLAARHLRLEVERETLAAEGTDIDRELRRLEQSASDVELDLAAAERRHADAERTFDEAQAAVSAARGARERARTADAGRRGDLQLLAERVEGLERETARERASREEGEVQLAAWAAEESALLARQEELRAVIAGAEAELAAALEERSTREEGVARRQGEVAEGRERAASRETSIRALRGELDAVRAAASELKVAEASLRQDAEHLRQAYLDALGQPPPESWGLSREPAADVHPASAAPAGARELAEIEAELAACKAALEALGPVNLLAAEEHAEQEKRLEFLSAQHADVATSVERLRATIREINVTSSERFLAAFEAINQLFGDTFRALFRGGEATMHLMDEGDLLETGVEIVARPPGKRLQNLMLLSGGEKALTAIALLFALFRLKPSPFCVLDEVDAPLDDINTLRFVELLQSLSAETQFVVITHNKLTMEAASMLYGVTMQERGVSKLVSVRLEDLEWDGGQVDAAAEAGAVEAGAAS